MQKSPFMKNVYGKLLSNSPWNTFGHGGGILYIVYHIHHDDNRKGSIYVRMLNTRKWTSRYGFWALCIKKKKNCT